MKDSELFNILTILSILSPLFPLVAGLVFGLITKRIAQLIMLSAVLSFSTDILSWHLASNGTYTDSIMHGYTMLSGCFIYSLYYQWMDSKFMKILVVVLATLLLICEVYEVAFWKGLHASNFISSTFLSLSILLLSLIFFFRRMETITSRNEIFDYLFWFNSALLFFFGTTIIITLFESYIRFDSPEIFIFIWPIQLCANILFNLLLLRGLWAMKKM